MRRALFPGSFDPFTKGHANIVKRGLDIFDEIVIAIGFNEHKHGLVPADERVTALKKFYADNPRISVKGYSCLTADFAHSEGCAFILRGIRSIKDYEYELQMADINRQITGVETVLLFADPSLSCISSSMVRELAHFNHPTNQYLPEGL